MQVWAPKLRAPIPLLIRLLSTWAVAHHVSLLSFVYHLGSCCLLCNPVCSLENLVQIVRSQYTFETWQELSVSISPTALQPRAWGVRCCLCTLALPGLLHLSVPGGAAEGAGSSHSFEGSPEPRNRADLQRGAGVAASAAAKTGDVVEQPKRPCAQTHDLWAVGPFPHTFSFLPHTFH